MIAITPQIAIREEDMTWSFVRSSGPGGQNVNKVATAVQLRFNVAGAASLPEDVRARVVRLAGKRVTSAGELVIEARRYRSQERNRQDAMDRLITLIRTAAEPPTPRKKTKPSAAATERRLRAKRHRSTIKQTRRGAIPPDG